MAYDLDLERKPQKQDNPRPGCVIFLWFAFALVFAAFAFFGYRVFTYYGQIKRGELVELPQFQDHFTSLGGTGLGSSAPVDRALIEAGDQPTEGPAPANAELVVVQFADFECPYSKEEATVVRTLMKKYGDRVRFVYRDYPLETIHPNAMQAALAAECAREQGKFWAYHDKLYVNAPVLDFQSLVRYADESGLDGRQFERCLVDERYKEKVTEDANLAKSLGIRGTPTFFLNGQRIEGAVPADTFEQLIGRFLNK